MTSNTKRSLFGGALMAAGLVAPAVQGQNFVWGLHAIGAYAVDYADFTPFVNDYANASGPFTVGATVQNASASAYGNASTMRIDAGSSAANYIGICYDFVSHFQVDANTNMDISWDLTAGQGWWSGSSSMSIYDQTNGVLLLSADKFGNPVGSTQLSLAAGIDYYATGAVSSYDGAGKSYFEMKIPSPGAAGLLGVAGILACRRRR